MLQRVYFALLIGLMACPAQAQPLHESLVECAVLVDEMLGDDIPPAGSNPQVDFWVGFEEVLRVSAIERAGQSYWETTAPIKQTVWAERWAGEPPEHPKNVGETMEWMDYCLSLADHLQL